VNVLEHPVELNGLTGFDRAVISATLACAPVSYAFSFMKDGREAAWIRESAPDCSVIGKIERHEATRNVDAIAEHADALWICRGDLGAQLGIASMARWISGFDPARSGRPVLMAGQVLEHMTRHSDPTRSEACHLFDLCARGYAGFVLSDETAVGRDPVAAVRTLRELLAAFGA
jgi:pyruvate kinase